MAQGIACFQTSEIHSILLPDANGIGNKGLVIGRHHSLDNLIRRILDDIRCQFARDLFSNNNTLAIRPHFCNHIRKVLNCLAFWIAYVLRRPLRIHIFQQPMSLLDYEEMLQSKFLGWVLVLKNLPIFIDKHHQQTYTKSLIRVVSKALKFKYNIFSHELVNDHRLVSV